jgi:hypothetical protein
MNDQQRANQNLEPLRGSQCVYTTIFTNIIRLRRITLTNSNSAGASQCDSFSRSDTFARRIAQQFSKSASGGFVINEASMMLLCTLLTLDSESKPMEYSVTLVK